MGQNLTSQDSIDGGADNDELAFTDTNSAANDLDDVTGIERIVLGNAPTTVTTLNSNAAASAILTVDARALTTATSVAESGMHSAETHIGVSYLGRCRKRYHHRW
jgi:hypothetical protein